MAKVLVTGGAGFIGSHICEALLNRGDEVFCVDNFLTGSRKNVEHLENNSLFHVIEWDVTKPLNKISNFKFPACQQAGQISNYIYHLASPASPVQYQKYPIETILANSLGTYNLLELAKATGAKFLFASSSEVYGNPKEHPQRESYWGNVNPIGIRSCYDEGKRCGEALVLAFVRQFDLDARIARIFNTYGPRMEKDDGRVVSNFINQAISGKPITVYGDGSQTRSFCYVSDMVDGLIRVIEEERARGEIFNLGNPEEHTILEFAQIIKNLSSSPSEITFESLPEDDPIRRCPDITKVKTILGWEPKIELEEGLVKTIEYFRSLK